MGDLIFWNIGRCRPTPYHISSHTRVEQTGDSVVLKMATYWRAAQKYEALLSLDNCCDEFRVLKLLLNWTSEMQLANLYCNLIKWRIIAFRNLCYSLNEPTIPKEDYSEEARRPCMGVYKFQTLIPSLRESSLIHCGSWQEVCLN